MEREKPKRNLRYYLKGMLSEKELALMPSAFDVVGDIMIFADFPKELKKKEKDIAKVILENYPHTKVVAKKAKKYSGKFRLPTIRIMGGERRKETVHRENGVLLEVHVEKAYFSPRSGTERQRIANQVKEGESILVMFSGVGPFTIELAKHTKAKEVYGVEINPVAHHYAEINTVKNKVVGKVKNYNGDVKKIVPKLGLKFDRIIMPLPKGAEQYLPLAISTAKKGGTIHFYDFLHQDEFEKAKEKIAKACEKQGRKFRLLGVVPCGQYSPGYFRVCADFVVL